MSPLDQPPVALFLVKVTGRVVEATEDQFDVEVSGAELKFNPSLDANPSEASAIAADVLRRMADDLVRGRYIDLTGAGL